jgi:hypothetical protein
MLAAPRGPVAADQGGGGSPESDHLGRGRLGALVECLIERVLAVGARLAPHDRSGLPVEWPPGQVHALAVGFHLQLLQVAGQPGVKAGHHLGEPLRADRDHQR